MKRLLALAMLLLTCVCALTSCGAKKTKIGIALYQDSGAPVTALKNFLAEVGKELDVEFTYTVLGFDAAENKTKLETMVASGVKGIISTMDSATAEVLKTCEKRGVWYAGYLCDFDEYINTANGNYSKQWLGTVCDGPYNGTAWGQEIARRMIADGHKNIGMIKFPPFAYPHQSEMEAGFKGVIEAYNATAAAADKITVQEESTVLMFCNLDDTWFDEHPNVDAIFGMCGGIDNIYPVMVAQGKTNIKLYTAGFTKDQGIYNNFGTKGTATIQEMVYCNAESIIYPLVLMLNKINGTDFTDLPTTAQRVDSSQIRITSNADFDVVLSHSIMATGNYSDSFLTAAQVKALLAANGGTYAGLVAKTQSMTLADLRALNNIQ